MTACRWRRRARPGCERRIRSRAPVTDGHRDKGPLRQGPGRANEETSRDRSCPEHLDRITNERSGRLARQRKQLADLAMAGPAVRQGPQRRRDDWGWRQLRPAEYRRSALDQADQRVARVAILGPSQRLDRVDPK